MGGIPAPDSDLNPVGVVKGVDWYDDGSAGVSGSRLDQLSPTRAGTSFDSLNQEQRTITNQMELQIETFFIDKRPERSHQKTHLNQEQRTITNQTDLQNETEREGAEALAGRHMPSRPEPQGRANSCKRADLAVDDSGNFSNAPRFWQAVASGRKGKRAKLAT